MKKDLSIAMAIAKKNKKKMAKGGPVDTAETVVIPDRGYGKIIRTGMAKGGSVEEGPSEKENQKGVHKIVPNYDKKHSEVKHGQSEARYGDKKAKHEAVIEELRQMPKPKLQGLARGGMVESNLIKAHPLDAIGQILKEHEAHLESQLPPENETEHMDYNDEHAIHSQDMAEGGEVDEYGYPIKPPAPPAPRLDQIKASVIPKPMKPKDKPLYDYAEGGEVMDDDMMQDDDDDQPEPEAEDEDHASIASAIMAKRAKYAEGGAVDIDEDAEEQSNMYDKLNRAILKENYAEDMDDISQPQDSNEHGDSIDADDHDRISIMRRKMALKRMAK